MTFSNVVCLYRCRWSIGRWRSLVQWQRALHRQQGSLLGSNVRQQQLVVCNVWQSCLRATRKQHLLAVQQHPKNLQRRVFRTWVKGTVHLAAARATLLNVLSRIAQDSFACMLTVFSAWFRITSSMKRLRCILRRVVIKHYSRVLLHAWSAWRGWIQQCSVYRSGLSSAGHALKTMACTALHQHSALVRSFQFYLYQISVVEFGRFLLDYIASSWYLYGRMSTGTDSEICQCIPTTMGMRCSYGETAVKRRSIWSISY
jgi:hypothetical protein